MITVPHYMVGRRAALFGSGLLAFVLFCFVIVPIYAVFSEHAAEIDETAQQIGQYKARIAQAPELERELQSLRDRGRSYPGVIVSESTAIAQAQLQGDVKEVVDTNKGVVQSAQILPSEVSEGFDHVVVQYDLTVPMAHLKDLLYEIEAHTPYLFIDHVEIDAPLNVLTQSGSQSDPLMQIRWTVHGYRWATSR